MAEINLSAYQDRLDNLLDEDRFDEVMAHARHILKAFPKNLRSYQQLGDALFASSRWEEAAEVLRRLLGAQPQDFKTNSQLAAVYQQLGALDRAIWHAERAYDQRPNHQETISLIRDLYREERGTVIERMQLTASALAQQHVRANALEDALEVLDQALQRNPQRIDLKLFRARTLWLDGQRTAAAEAADAILEQLPYSIVANRIMSELWLSEQRPTDAQMYLDRIEDLNPYLAHQLATSEAPPDDLVTIEELDYEGIPRHEEAYVDPEWLDSLGEGEGDDNAAASGRNLGALFGVDEDDGEEAPATATSDLDDLLAEDEIESLFNELILGGTGGDSPAAQEDDAGTVLDSMDDQGFFDDSAAADEQAAQAEPAPLAMTENTSAQSSGDDGFASLDEDLARMLEQLDADEEDSSWLMDIQQGGLADGESLQYLEDFDRDWLLERESEDVAAGAPWLSAAMREMMDEQEGEEDFDLFAEDEHLQDLLKKTTDTEPIQVGDIESWLNAGDKDLAAATEATGVESGARDDDLLADPSEDSWLDEDFELEAGNEAPMLRAPVSDEEQTLLNAELIDNWQMELDDDDNEDPYVDWLSEDSAAEVDKDLGIFAAQSAEGASDQADAPLDEVGAGLPLEEGSAAETARAWGLTDKEQLADFVEEEVRLGDAEAAPSWLNAMVPGLDREGDAEPDNELEFARPTARPGKEFAWVSELVDEETGEMEALDPEAPPAQALYFRFSNPPSWLASMQRETAPPPVMPGGDAAPAVALTALAVGEELDELDLDDLTFDDYFNFDTATDKMDAINLDEAGEGLDFAALEWDDYFDFDSPTEKTIAITLDEDPADINFQELGVEDEVFDFDTPTDKMPAITLKDEPDPLEFEDIGLNDEAGLIDAQESGSQDGGEWLNYDKTGAPDEFEEEDRDKSGGQAPL